MRRQSFRLQGDVFRLRPIEDQHSSLLQSTVASSRVDLNMNLPAGMTPYILDMSVDVYEDYQAVIRIAVVIAQQVRPKEGKI